MTYDGIMKITTNAQWFALGMSVGMLLSVGVFVTSYVLFGP
jgi:hypothetical protein